MTRRPTFVSCAAATVLAAACTLGPQGETATDQSIAPAARVTLPAEITTLAAINGSAGVVAGLSDGQVAMWNGADSEAVMLQPHAARVLAVGATRDGTQVWSVAADGSLARTAFGSATPVALPRVDLGPARARVAAFSGDGSVLVTGGEFGEIRVFDTSSGTLRHQLLGHRTELQALAIRPDAFTVASASAEADLRIWDATAGRAVGLVDGELSLFALAFSPQNGTLAAGGVDRRLTLRDPNSFTPVGELKLAAPKMVASLAWSPDGRFLAVGDIDDTTLSKGGIAIVDAATRAVVANLDTGGVPVFAVTFVADARVVAVVGQDLRTWTVDVIRSNK
jgi:WD40 repeat protein